ncbi:replication initiator protein A [Staphylococcus equorum]|uniref:replication initiator protein A n=1 Tax=Staphylococcus equorum TaxID=246432 RepID=UPI003FD7EA46
MSKENKYTENSVEIQKFYKLPRFLYKDMRYDKMNHSVKLLYAIIFDDYTLAKRYQADNPNTTHFLDKDKNTYVAPKREDLADLLNCSVDTITRLKNQLVKHGLLKQERSGGNRPNRLYPLVPENIEARGFFKLPKMLFKEPFYKCMANITKVAYGFVNTRFAMSSENDFKDDEGKVCCRYSYNSLASDLKCSRNTVTEIKNELLALGLIFQVKDKHSQSLNFYLRQPHIKQEATAEKEDNKKESKTVDISEKRKNDTMDTANEYPLDTANEYPNYTTGNKTTLSNTCTNDKSDKNIESMSTKKPKEPINLNNTNTEMDSDFYKAEKERYFSKYPRNIGMALKPYNLEDAQTYMRIICKAKNVINQEQHMNYTLEDMELDIARRIDAVKRVMKKNNEQPKDMLGYFKVAMLDCVEEYNIQCTLDMLRESGFNETELTESEKNLHEKKEERMRIKKQQLRKNKVQVA